MKSMDNWTIRSEHERSLIASMKKEDEDADYRPILRGVINTRCNYDGSKIEGSMEG